MKLKIIFAVLLLSSYISAKKKKTSKKENLFDNKTLNCLVCKSLVEEIEAAINKIDPSKKVEVGSHRINGDGTQNKKLVRFLKFLTCCLSSGVSFLVSFYT